ncbi:uncharacterized protein [Hemitrygon akajei]|uniref:uncharacterized protein n=1 Tax=Hemitrygon akajei TaxID=2704970 RepID=UPI003BF9D4C2
MPRSDPVAITPDLSLPSRWSCPAERPKCYQDDDNQQSPVRIRMDKEPEFTISDLLAQGEEYRLYQLTKFYRDRLKQAIEEKVERLGWMLTKEGHFSRQENEKVTELTEKGNRTESSRLFLSLVNGKGSRARRAMWESFLMWRTELPKLDRILRKIQELGPDPQEYMNIGQGLSELPTQLIAVALLGSSEFLAFPWISGCHSLTSIFT